MFGICNLSLTPCRSQPSHKSEMVTQLLFGEHFSVLEEQGGWSLIKTAPDGYECWVDKKQYKRISGEEFNLINDVPQRLSLEFIKKIGRAGEHRNIFPGSVLPGFKKGKFFLGTDGFSFRGKSVLSSRKPNRNNIISTAKIYLNSPYLWGGRSPAGIDCSGLTQVVYKLNGIVLPRDAHKQAAIGESLNFVEEAQKGDLAFFDNEEGKIIHVGIVAGNSKIIHASGNVRTDNLDHYGIFNAETGKYSHNLRLIKRVL